MKGKKLLAGILSAAMVFGTMVFPALADNSWGGEDGTTVKVGENYYETLSAALNAVYKSAPSEAVTIECKPEANVGAMTHIHVEDDLIIEGNGAYVGSGERDMEFDTFMFSRDTGAQVKEGKYLQKDVTVKVNNLNGIAAWGERHTDNVVNLEFTNCKNMQRVYISGIAGKNNIKLTNCSFERVGNQNGAYPQGDATSVYSNAPGEIVIDNCDFTNITAYIIFAAAGFLTYALGSGNVYTWLFAVTKFARYMNIGITAVCSALIFHIMGLAVVFVATIGMDWVFSYNSGAEKE